MAVPARFRERLRPPGSWWALAAGFALSCGLALGFYWGWPWGLGVGLLAGAAGAGVLSAAASVLVVDDERIWVGRANLEYAYVGSARPLDAEGTARRSGPGADARAYLVLRPYVATAVELTLDDPADPTPYWLVSTRRPQALAAAVEAARAARLTR